MTVDSQQLDQWLQEGILAAKAGQMDEARYRLLDVVNHDQTNETAWYWLYQVFHNLEDKRICLENLLIINPDNQWARQELTYFVPNSGPATPRPQVTPRRPKDNTPPRPIPVQQTVAAGPMLINLLTAFWAGISLILIAGGLFATWEWLVAVLQTRSFPFFITSLQLFELFIAIILVIIGVIGLNVAIGLYTRSMLGFYGSILMALGLLLFGPTFSLISTPPNYQVLVCTGGISGMIVLLTLASQPAFRTGNAS